MSILSACRTDELKGYSTNFTYKPFKHLESKTKAGLTMYSTGQMPGGPLRLGLVRASFWPFLAHFDNCDVI